MKNLKLRIVANNKINKIKTMKINGETCEMKNDFKQIEIELDTDDTYADLEFWLNSLDDEYLDYMAMMITQRNKMRFYK